MQSIIVAVSETAKQTSHIATILYRYFYFNFNMWKQYTVNREIFVYENIQVLNIRVNKISRVPHKNTLTWKFCKVEITVHVSPIKRLLATYAS